MTTIERIVLIRRLILRSPPTSSHQIVGVYNSLNLFIILDELVLSKSPELVDRKARLHDNTIRRGRPRQKGQSLRGVLAGGWQTVLSTTVNWIWEFMPSSRIEPLLRRTRPPQSVLIAVAFWALATVGLINLRELYLWGMPGVQFMVVWATVMCCLIVVSLVGIQYSDSRREPVWSVSLWRQSIGTPGLFLFAAVASYLMIGTTVLIIERNWQPDTAGHLRYRVLCLGILVAAALGGRVALERIGADRLLRGVLVILIASCAVILASPVLRELGILPPYRISFRLTGAFRDPNDASLVTCMTVVLAVAFLTNGRPRKLDYAGLVMGTAATLATATRTAFLILVAILVLFALLNLRDKRKAVFLLSWTGGLIGIAVIAVQITSWTWLRTTHDRVREAALFCEPSSDDHSGADADCAILLAVKDVLAGDQALNWNRALPVQSWEGVTVDVPEGRITRLQLTSRALNGRIPPELGRLHGLVSLRLARNQLTGTIPPELGNLPALKHLALSFNLLTGTIPPELADLPNLEELWLRNNRLTGPVPPQLGESDSLSLVRLSGNDLDRPFPPALHDLPNNDFAEELFCRPSPRIHPGLLGDCTVLLAMRDELAGRVTLNWHPSIPIGGWQGVALGGPLGGPEARVKKLDLWKRGLTGRIPPELGRLHGLVSLRLARNQLTGTIPPELGNLPALKHLALSFNLLTGTIPPELADLPNLEELWLRNNRLTGPVPPQLGENDSLYLVRLSGNDLDRPFPPALHDLPNNDLAEELFCRPSPRIHPELLGDCTVLLAAREALDPDARLNWHEAVPIGSWRGVTLGSPEGRVIALELPRTGLNGRIPAALGSLSRLRTLVLDDNGLTGTIPPELGNLADLQVLSLTVNDLTGPVPTELARLSNLREVWLSDNHLTGPVPPGLGPLGGHPPLCPAAHSSHPGLRADCALLLAVKDTLAGDVRLNWSAHLPIGGWHGVKVGGPLKRVTKLELPRWNLNGRVPPELGRLSHLVSLDLSGNRLVGGIPSALGELHQLVALRLHRNRLTGPVPPEFGKLPRLRELELQKNDLTGPVPPQPGAIGSLSLPRLSGNDPVRPFPPLPYEIVNHDLHVSHPRRADALGHIDGREAESNLVCRPSSAMPPALLADCALLLAIKGLLVGEARLNWSENLPIGFWQGISTGGSPRRVSALELPRAGLNGRLVPELGDLSGLVALDLRHNRLTGPIPSALGGLEQLVSLRLEHNELTGPVPSELGAIDNLSFLRLSDNDLTRPFPPTLYAIEDHDLDTALSCRSGRSDSDLLADCALLLAVKDELAGNSPLNWSPDVPLEDWQGVTVDPSRNRVAVLDLMQLGLNGRIPPEVERLDGLVSLRLSRNRLIGSVPPGLGSLLNLRELWLDDNRLGGPIPPELGKLSRLADLRLKGNTLIGPLPPSVAALPELAALHFDGDETSTGGHSGVADEGPRCQAAATRLYSDCSTLLEVRDRLAGDVGLNWSATVPIDHWRGVTLGFPPAVAGAVASGPRIVALELSHMGLNGHIPAELSALDALAVLHLGDNRIGGSIPPELGALTGLWALTLENNALTGTIPAELGALRRLVWLRLGGNELTGPVPWEISTLAELRVLSLEDNTLTGRVPQWLDKLGRLEALRLENNRLHGDIPQSLPRLEVLRLDGNALYGCIPLTRRAAQIRYGNIEPDLLCQPPPWRKPDLFDDAAHLMLARDVLAGGAPLNWSYANPVRSWQGVKLDRAGRVRGLDLRVMNLSGRIPPELGKLGHLQWLQLDGNRLTGPIPPELGKLTYLRMLSLGDNHLTGPIPPELGDLLNLHQLWLDNNRLSGPIPPELGAINIYSLRIAGNDIADTVTSEMDRRNAGTFLENLGTALKNRRLLLWKLGFEKAMEAPLFGHGLGTLQHLDSGPIGHHDKPLGVHNLYLTLLGEAGIVPLSLFLLSFFLLLRSHWRAPKSVTRDAAAGWVIAIALYGMAFQHLLGVAAFMFMAGLSAAMAVSHDNDRSLAKA